MSSLKLIQKKFHNLALEVRSIEYILATQHFEDALDTSTSSEQDRLERILLSVDKKRLMQWIRDQLKESYSCWPITRLRHLARSLQVPRYAELPKQLLLSEICRRRQNEKADQ